MPDSAVPDSAVPDGAGGWLPAIPASAGAMIFDRKHRLLILKPTYKHGWTIPVAYDADGGVGGLYGVTACPLVELAYRGGTVAQRLICEHWLSEAALEARVQALLRRG